MSHFAVLVIGEDVVGQLAPYHEFECTGRDDRFVLVVDITATAVEAGLEKCDLEDRTVASMDEVDLEGKHKFGYAILDADGAVVKAVRRTNPDGKWDWYVVGGRWAEYLRLKGGRSASFSVKGAVDLSGMRDEAEKSARALWAEAREITGGESWESWASVRGRLSGNAGAARAAYGDQAAVVRLGASGHEAFSWNIDDDLAMDVEFFVGRARANACSFFAFVREGKWTEKGKMGWFAMVSDATDEDAWTKNFNDMLDALPDDSMLTVVDCHT